MTAYLLRIAAWLSQGINCILLGGHHDMTVSSRCYINRERPGWRVAYRVIDTIFFWQDGHCLQSYQADVRFAMSILNMDTD